MTTFPTHAPLLDLDHLGQFAEVGIEDLDGLLEDMIHDVPSTLGEISRALQSRDGKAFLARVHSARGMLANYGCAAMADKLLHLETAGALPSGDPAEITGDLARTWELTESALRAWMAAL